MLEYCKKEFQVLPVAFTIQYYNDRNPEVIIRFGELINSDSKKSLKTIKSNFIKNIDTLDEESVNRSFKKEILYGKL